MQNTEKSIRPLSGGTCASKNSASPPQPIRVLLKAREGVPFPVADGITLVVAPDLHASGMEVEPLVERLGDLLRKILEKKYTCTPKRERK